MLSLLYFKTAQGLFGGQHDYFRGKTDSPQMVVMVLFLDIIKNKAKFKKSIGLPWKIFK